MLDKQFNLYKVDTSSFYVDENGKRVLNEDYITYKDKITGEPRINVRNVVSMFVSTLSRSLGIEENTLTKDLVLLEIFYYDIAKDLILNGFDYDGVHYIYFSSSAGQIRTKKAVFVNEQKYNAISLKLMCGLTRDIINAKGGMNVNKYLAYTALCNTATDTWMETLGKPFDIDRCIVVDDFETLVHSKVDHIDYETFDITEGKEEDVPIPHTDGCGMILPSVSTKNFMVRLPFVKGLLGVFDFRKFLVQNNYSSKVCDIWGKEYDIFDDDITIIFTKSQLKMYKFYDSWEQYKDNFKKYKCEAAICNYEEDNIKRAKINYQMLQTLYDMTDEEVIKLCADANGNIDNIAGDISKALGFFGISKDHEITSNIYYQKALKLYPELLNDPATKQEMLELKNSMVKKYRSAKLDVVGKFTFVLPDLYAFCEWLFGKIPVPKGLLDNGEVFCRLYPTADELDCLRSPHLYIEHAVRKNVVGKKCHNQILRDWFITDAIYTSTYDTISKMLQFDVDGDRLLVLAQKDIIKIAKRCMENVYPLYYEMKKANAELITNETIYNGLINAFSGGRIGSISNNITKIWNSGEITDEKKKAIRWLCMETNFSIDYAKTLFKPTRPEKVDLILKELCRAKVPYFFQFAKNKRPDQCEEVVYPLNTINKICKEIHTNNKMFKSFKKLANVDYRLMLSGMNGDNYCDDKVNELFKILNRRYGININVDSENSAKNNFGILATEMRKDMEHIEKDIDKIVDSLVVFLYSKPSLRRKKLLWLMYGKQIYENLKNNMGDNYQNFCWKCGERVNYKLVDGFCKNCKSIKVKKCIECGKEFEVNNRNKVLNRCPDCQRKHVKMLTKERVRKFRKCNAQ